MLNGSPFKSYLNGENINLILLEIDNPNFSVWYSW